MVREFLNIVKMARSAAMLVCVRRRASQSQYVHGHWAPDCMCARDLYSSLDGIAPVASRRRDSVFFIFLVLRKHKFVTFMFLQFISVFSFRFIHFFNSLQHLAPLLFSHHSSWKKKTNYIRIFIARLSFRADEISAASDLSQTKKRKHSVLRLNNSEFRLVL